MKLVHSLRQKKGRESENLFVAEGKRLVTDLVANGMRPVALFVTEASLPLSPVLLRCGVTPEVCSASEMNALSGLVHPPKGEGMLGLFPIPADSEGADVETVLPAKELCLALDGVQDPGNLGTILRTADWFGIRHVFASAETADVYAPKVVQATMGAVARVRVHRVSLPDFLEEVAKNAPVYGTFLDGDDLYARSIRFEDRGVLVMGNEGRGISEEVAARVTHRLLIPPYPAGGTGAESLNVGAATAILCAEMRRSLLKINQN
ncbi:MAG: RNA methyltransferase [Alloprevotella sp.]